MLNKTDSKTLFITMAPTVVRLGHSKSPCYAKVLLRLSQGKVPPLVDELLYIFQWANLKFSSCGEQLKTRNHCCQIISIRSNRVVMKADPVPESIDVKKVRGNNPAVLYKKDIVQILRNQVLLACNEEARFRRRQNVQGLLLTLCKLQVF